MTITLLIVWALIFFLLTVIAGLEYTYLASNKLTIEIRRNSKSNSGKRVAHFFDYPDTFWNTTVFTFYILLVIFVILSSKIISNTLMYFPRAYEFFNSYFYWKIVLDFIIISLLLILSIGFLSKRSFEKKPESKLENWSLIIQMLSFIALPLSNLFIKISEFILEYLFNVKINKNTSIFERINIHNFIRKSIQGFGNIDEENQELFQKAIQLNSIKVRNCTTPRNEIIAIEKSKSIQELKRLFSDTKLSKIIVYDENLDNVIGYVHHLDLIKNPESIKEILYDIPIVPETMSVIDLLNKFSTNQKSIAWVIEEYGGTAGFITLEDILEEVFGEISDEYDTDLYLEQSLDKNNYLLSGRLEIEYLNRKYRLNIPSHYAKTLSGYIINRYGRIPSEDDKFILDHFEVEILKVTETKIDSLKLRSLL